MKLSGIVFAASTILVGLSTTGTDAAPPPRQLEEAATPESPHEGNRVLKGQNRRNLGIRGTVKSMINRFFNPPGDFACVPDSCPGGCFGPPEGNCRAKKQKGNSCDVPSCSCGADGVVTCTNTLPCTCDAKGKGKGMKGCDSPCTTCDCGCGVQDPAFVFSIFEEGCQPGTCGKGNECHLSAFNQCSGSNGDLLDCNDLSDKRVRNRLLKDASYNPTPEEALQVAKETGGNPDAVFALQEGLLTPEECAGLVAYIDEHQDTATRYMGNDDDLVIMAHAKDPLQKIIGEERARELYQHFKDNSDGAPVTQVWLRNMGGADTFMGLHTDTMPYQMKINLNDDFEDGDTLVVDGDGARPFKLGVGDGYTHGPDLVHGHMPFRGNKYILYVISDPNPSRDLSAELLAVAA